MIDPAKITNVSSETKFFQCYFLLMIVFFQTVVQGPFFGPAKLFLCKKQKRFGGLGGIPYLCGTNNAHMPRIADSAFITTQTPTPVVIHQAALGDASGSMKGPKYEAAKAGIQALRDKAVSLGYSSFTFIEFAGKANCFTELTQIKPKKENKIKFQGANGGTPLHETLILCIDFLKAEAEKRPGEFFLFNVYTDGDDTSYGRFREKCREAVLSLPKNITLTFICRAQDASNLVGIGADTSNISTYDDTGEGLTESIIQTTKSMESYKTRAAAGEDVSFGFYKK